MKRLEAGRLEVASWRAFLWGFVLAIALVSCQKTPPPPRRAPVPVDVAPVVQKTMPIELRAIGHVQSRASVSIIAQIGGEIQNVAFGEGQFVERGDLLFQIDPRPAQEALAQALGVLERDRAQAAGAAADVRRYAALVEKEYVTRQQYDQVLANSRALDAAVRADEATVQNARLTLAYTTITAPISGRAGALLVHRGDVVKANDKPLVVINQIEPIDVAFAVPEQFLGQIQARARAGEQLRVAAFPRGGSSQAHWGALTFIDNQVDLTTGTILLKATFPNADHALWPGQFADVVLVLGEQPDAVVVPAQAVQTGQAGRYVFVVQPDRTVVMAPVQVDRTIDQMTVIREGVKPGQQVVTDGQLQLTPGAEVKVKGGTKPGT